MPINTGQAGTFSGWLKTDDLTGAACLTADYLDGQGHAILSFRSPPVTGSSHQFTALEWALSPTMPDANTLRVGLNARVL